MRTAGLSSVDVEVDAAAGVGVGAGAGADVVGCCAIWLSAMTARVVCLLSRMRPVVTSSDNTTRGRCLDHIDAKVEQACVWSEGAYVYIASSLAAVCTFYDLIPERLGREGSRELEIRATSNVQGSEERKA